MILNRHYRFLFVKTAKTAGTSLEIALSRFTGAGDIVTPISAVDERIRRSAGCGGPQNYRVAPGACGAWNSLRRWIPLGKPDFYNHISVSEVRRLLTGAEAVSADREFWDSCYKFCVERNPFDRAISLYYWCCRSEPRMPLTEFLESPQLDVLRHHGLDLYTNPDGSVAVDRVLRYENLAEELEEVRQLLGLPEPLVLPRAKGGHRRDLRHYSEIMTARDRRIIEDRFQRELSLWNYAF